MSPAPLSWSRWVRADVLLERIQQRLGEAGDIEGLRRIGRMSAQETAVLLELEARDA